MHPLPSPLSIRTVSRASRFGGLLLLGSVAACALPGMNHPGTDAGKDLIASGQYEAGLAKLKEADAANPRQPEVHNAYVTQRDAIVSAYLRDADAARSAGDLALAEQGYLSALRIDAGSVLAKSGLNVITRQRRLQQQSDAAQEALRLGDIDSAERIARGVLAEDSQHRGARAVMHAVAEERQRRAPADPKLRAALQRKITLELRDTPIRTAFEVISRAANINFVLDRDVRTDQKTTIFVRDTNLDEVLHILLLTNQLESKVLNDNSVVVYPNTAAKQRDYQDLVMRSFYIANADVKQTASMIRAMVKTKDVFVDEKLNLLIMRDTPEAVRLAEQLVATQDLGEPEVVLEVEVLEVATDLLQNLGVQYPTQVVANFPTGGSIVTGDGSTDGSTGTTLVPLRSSGLRAYVANPALILNLNRSDSGTNLLANPRIRVKNREKAKILIGEKVPVITTTSTANVGVSSSVNYIDTGLKLEVEPTVYLENDVGIKISLEVSNILSQLNISGTVAYTLGTRNAETSLRLRDGETQILAGLINNSDTRSAAKVPIASNFPVLGQLFQSNKDETTKSEVILLITPHVVRNLVRPETVSSRIAAGTEAAPGALPLRLSEARSQGLVISGGSEVATAAPASAAPVRLPAPASVAAPAPAPAPAAAPAPAGEPGRTLLASGPAQAKVGQEFTVNVTAPEGTNGGTATLNVRFDPEAVTLVGGGTKDASGGITVQVTAPSIAGVSPVPATLRFNAKSAAHTEIGFSGNGANAGLAPPLPLVVDIAP